MQSTTWMSWWVWHLGLDLNEEPMEGNNVDDWPTILVEASSSI